MMMRPIHLLLIAAVIGIQAATDEAYLDSMIDDGVSAGRRGGRGSLTTAGSFTMAVANRAGNDEEEFGEADEDPPTPQADLAKLLASPTPHADLAKLLASNSLSVGEALDADAEGSKVSLSSLAKADADGKAEAAGADAVSITTLSTPVLLASCKKSWPFQIKGTDKTIHACVKCKPDAPLPFVIAKHGKRLIWACDANKFKEEKPCEKSLSWLDPPETAKKPWSETGQSAEKTCPTLRNLIANHDDAAKVYSKHSQDLKLSTTAKLASVSLVDSSQHSYNCLTTHCHPFFGLTVLGKTRMQVEKTISVAQMKGRTGSKTQEAQVFTVLSHTVRACGYIPEQPLQCLDIKQSQCIWSIVKSEEDLTKKSVSAWFGKFKSGQKIPGKVSSKKEEQDQHCGPDVFLHLTTSRKL